MGVNKVVMNTPNGEETIIDLTSDSVTPETLAEGVTAHDASGEPIVGTATFSSGGGIPSYWLEELETKAEAIQLAMETAGRNKSAFLWYTDAHWVNNAKMSPVLLKYLEENTPMNKTNFGGDIVGDPATFTHENIEYVYDWRKRIVDLSNHHSVTGNHDLNHRTTDVVNMAYAFLIAPEESADMVMGDELYYYVDNPAEKTRYLYLSYMMNDHTAMMEQGKFIVDAIKSVEEGWHIVAINHRWFQYTSSENPTVGSIPIYEADILSVFDAYNARVNRADSNYFYAQDFTDAKGKVEFCIGGHIHADYDFASEGGIPVIITTADTNQERVPDSEVDSGTVGTITESAVYGIIADYTDAENTKITVVGVGRGTSRIIGEQNSVTNLLNIFDRTYEVGTANENITSYFDESKAYTNVSYTDGKLWTNACTVSDIKENSFTVKEPGVGGICVAYPVELPNLKNKSYKISFDYAGAGSGKSRVYWRGFYSGGTLASINTICNSGSGESGHVDVEIVKTADYDRIVVFFGSNTSGTTTFSNVSLTEM